MVRLFSSLSFFLLLFQSCKPHLSTYNSENSKIDKSLAGHAIDSITVPFRNEMQLQMAEVIGYSDSSLISYAPESPLSNFVADVIFESGFEYAKNNDICTDSKQLFCLLNFGGLRTSLNQGEITRGDIYELMPFDNAISIVKISHEKMSELMSYLRSAKGQPVSNISISLNENSLKYSVGKSLQPLENYYVITSDYLAGGGDKMDFLKSPLESWNTGVLMRDALIQFILKKKTIPYSPVEGRIYFE